jgi:hypothetical protein
MKGNRDDNIIYSPGKWEMGRRKLSEEFSNTQVTVILKLLDSLTDRLER